MKKYILLHNEAMERLFHYVWKHRLFPPQTLTTTDGRVVEVVDVGIANADAGPDFCNAKVLIDGQLWAGNVELHIKASQWVQHGHDSDKAYNSVVLHVVCEADCEVYSAQGEHIPQVVLPIPPQVRRNYEHLLHEDRYPRCYKLIPSIPVALLAAWLAHLFMERLERKTRDIMKRVAQCNGSWEEAFFQTLARNFGFGVNSDAFEQWAKSIPLHSVDHHRDNLFQVEAFFFGQAGLLDASAARPQRRARMVADPYYQRLAAEYKFLAHKFALRPIDPTLWRFLRLRPQAFPTIRLSQLVQLHYNRTAGLSQILSCQTLADVRRALATHVTAYWQTHYLFGEDSEQSDKQLTKTSIEGIIINTIVPIMFAYGRYRSDKALQQRALALMGAVGVEKNNVVRLWRECGLTVSNARDSQALIQLKTIYCDRKDCLRCRIGRQYLRINN